MLFLGGERVQTCLKPKTPGKDFGPKYLCRNLLCPKYSNFGPKSTLEHLYNIVASILFSIIPI